MFAFLSNPWVNIPLAVIGTLIIAYTWGDALAEYRVQRAGGITKREFPARLKQWDKVKSFAVWQVAWLWNGLEPYNVETSGTLAYPTFRRLKEDLNAGAIKEAHQKDGSWKDTTISRQSLVDYAYKIDEFPTFLFPEERTWLSRQRARLFRDREVPPELLSDYRNIYHWYTAGQSMTPQMGIEQVREWIFGELKRGRMEAVGRPRRDGVDWPYVYIPQKCWKRLTFDWADSVTYKDRQYISIRLKLVKNDSSHGTA